MKNLIRSILLILLVFCFYHLFGNDDRVFDNVAYFSLDGIYSVILLFFILQFVIIKIHKCVIWTAIGYHLLKIALIFICYFSKEDFFMLINNIGFSIFIVVIVMLLLIISIFYKNESKR